MSVEVKDGVVVLDEVMVKSKSEVVDDSDAVEIEDEVSGESIVAMKVAKISKKVVVDESDVEGINVAEDVSSEVSALEDAVDVKMVGESVLAEFADEVIMIDAGLDVVYKEVASAPEMEMVLEVGVM
jgi:hypothetical protein